MSFATGMQMGFQHQRDVADRALQAEREKRAQEVHALQVAEMQRQARLGAETDAARKDLVDSYNTPPPDAAPAGIPMSRAPRMDNPGAAFLAGPGAPAGAPIPRAPSAASMAPAEGSGLQMSRAPGAAPPTDVGGLAGPSAKPNDPFRIRQQQVNARKQYALRTGDTRTLQAVEQEERGLQRDQAMSRIPELIKSEEFRASLNKFINDQSSYVTIIPGQKDPRTGRQMYEASIVQPDGQGKRVPLSNAQYMKLAQGQVLMELGDAEGGMKAFNEANAEVAAALDRQGRNAMDAGRFNADQADKADASRHRQATLGEQSRHNRATEGNDAARTAAAVGKQVSPATLEKLRVLEVAYIQAQGDPVKQQQLRQQYEILSANAAAEVGKPRGLPERGGPMNQQQQIEARAKLKAAGYDDAQIEQMITGYDPWAKIAEMIEARGRGSSTPVDPNNPLGASAGPGSAPAASAPRPNYGTGLQGIRQVEKASSDAATRRYLERTGGR